MTDMFTFGAAGTGRFCNRFAYHEILYVTVIGLQGDLNVEDVVGYRIRTDLQRTGEFSCSSPLLTKIYETTINVRMPRIEKDATAARPPHYTVAVAAMPVRRGDFARPFALL